MVAQILDFVQQTGFSQIKAGLQALAEKDAVEQDSNGLAWKAQVTDNVIVATRDTTTIAETTLTAGGAKWSGFPSQRAPLLKHPTTSDIYIGRPTSNATDSDGLTVERRSSTGVLKATNTLIASGTVLSEVKLCGFLSNGNLLVGVGVGGITFYTLDPSTLKLINTSGIVSSVDNSFDAIPLSGGGFAYAVTTSPNERLGIRNNDTSVNVAEFTMITWTGGASGTTRKMVQLSSGDIALGIISNYATNFGFYSAIYSIAGTTVLAPRRDIAVLPGANPFAEIAQVTGFWAYMSTGTTGGTRTVVLNNAGVIQGTARANANNTGSGVAFISLLADADGTQFWSVENNSVTADTFFTVTQVPTSGASNATAYRGPDRTGTAHAAFYDRGKIAMLSAGSTTRKQYGVFDAINKTIELAATLIGTVNAGSESPTFAMVATGDWTFLMLRSADATGQSVSMFGKKYAASSLKGAAFTAIAASALGYLRGPGAGNVAINALQGTASVAVDHSATTPVGIKGSISLNSMYM